MHFVGILLLKVFGVLLLIVIVQACRKHFAIQSICKRLAAQGMYVPDNNGAFLIGPLLSHQPEFDRRKKTQVLPNIMQYVYQTFGEKERKPGDPLFDASRFPMVTMNLLGRQLCIVSDPEVVQDMYVKESKHIEKSKFADEFFQALFTDVFASMPTNDEWKK